MIARIFKLKLSNKDMKYKERALWSYALAVLVTIFAFIFPNYLSFVHTLLLLILGVLFEIAGILEKKK